ncbi:MAG: family 10 glycosylhydrolase [Oscillospiraceae bacterium]|jgi:uncharacterized lipoprotein YddW (UPF0748 family)|nr:family 10 glycosylhydrolase [Oscillospiraceae bacterium]
MGFRRFFKIFPFIAVSSILIFVVGFIYFKSNKNNNASNNPSDELNKSQSAPETPAPKMREGVNSSEEMRAVWVPFTSLDVSKKQGGEESFKETFNEIVKVSKEHFMNTLIVHVRSHSDAMYESELFPWSHLLTGEQGKDPGYDPLKYMVKAAHENGLKIHAWINPLRVQLSETPKSLSGNNPFVKFRKSSDENLNLAAIDFEGGKYYNPASPEVRKLIIQGVKEMVKKYGVDGIHLDDYFYPTEGENFDKSSYEKYCKIAKQTGQPLNLGEFRKANINAIVSGIYSVVKDAGNIEFGISPRCDIDYDLSVGADVKLWGNTKGYVDYLCPQIYMNFEHPKFPFDKTANEWRKLVKGKDVKLYLGLGVYKGGSLLDNGTWNGKNDILSRQVEYGRKINCEGFMLFSFNSFFEKNAQDEVVNVMKVFN